MAHIHRFYVGPDTPFSSGIALSGEEAHHALRVVRVHVGDPVILFDGAGREMTGAVSRVGGHEVGVQVEGERRIPRPATRLTLIQGWLNRTKPIDSLIRRGTEIGVSCFRFFPAKRSERPLGLDERWKRIAVEACKQCGRVWLPEFQVVEDLAGALIGVAGDLLVATSALAPMPIREALTSSDIALLVGPEGDLTEEELALAVKRGAKPVSLGPRTYRSEVAATLAATLILYELGEFGGA